MKAMLLISILLIAAIGPTTDAMAEIGWAGNVWPNTGADLVPTGPVDTYCQVWKDGVTDPSGQALDITAVCEISSGDGNWTSISTLYNGDVGSNDEYTAQIPQWFLVGNINIYVHWKFRDDTDNQWYLNTSDQAGNPAPQVYDVVNVLPNNVQVQFSICLSGETSVGDVCVTGSAPELGSWSTGHNLSSLMDGQYWAGAVTLPAGSNPTFEYKYRKDGCDTWESVDNRIVTLPTDGTTFVPLSPDSWNNLPLGCGLGSVLEEDKTLCLQVCMDGIENSGGICVSGSSEQLTDWGAGVPAEHLGGGLYQVCVVYPAGTPNPLNVYYKFKKDGCSTWEDIPNRLMIIENSLIPEVTLTYGWEIYTSGNCEPIANSTTSWGTLKNLYR